MSTKTFPFTLGAALDQANPNQLADALALVKLGTLLGAYDVTFTGLASAAAQNITTAAALAAATINSGTTLPNSSTTPPGGTLPPILSVISLRDAHANIVVDAGGAAVASTGTYPGTALLSNDGTTITFAAAVTGFRIKYLPRPFTALSALFANENPNPDEV